jgi:hypothetical protein
MLWPGRRLGRFERKCEPQKSRKIILVSHWQQKLSPMSLPASDKALTRQRSASCIASERWRRKILKSALTLAVPGGVS